MSIYPLKHGSETNCHSNICGLQAKTQLSLDIMKIVVGHSNSINSQHIRENGNK